jgi:hypothetical protein
MVSIRDILRNRAYLGTYARFGVRVPGSHPSLVSAEDFRRVQDRLNSRRTSFNPRVTSQFLLSGMAVCGYCGNKLIGVSRKQSWKRKSGERVENSYRYYQCESRTNQSVCSYHTRRAEALEHEVRESLRTVIAAPPAPASDGDPAVEQAAERERLQHQARTIDRRLQRYAAAAAKGKMSRERMRELSMSAARERATVDESLEQVERQAREHPSASDRAQKRRDDASRLVETWDAMAFGERQALLRDVAACVEVHDDRVQVTLRP